jgi:RNA polymerase sigma factor (sigma-70 family)
VESERVRELIVAARLGDTRAFAELVDGDRERLRLLAARMLGDGTEAEDVVQETLLRAYLGLTDLRDPARFGAWLAGITLNLARMTLRRRATYERALARVGPISNPDVFEERDLVRHAVEVLPARERDVVVLHYVEGLACDEIAELLGTTPGAVRVRLHRARAHLREELAPLAPREPEFEPKEETMIEVRLEDVLVRVAPEDAGKVVGDQRIVLLREAEGERLLPIWIGGAEGNALAFRLRGESTLRPMTSDLLAELVRLFGARVERVAVTRLHEKTFYGVITLAVDGRTEELDARPSDALNLAVRTAAPILVDAAVLEEAAIAPDDLSAKVDEFESQELEPGEWRSLSAELLHALHRPPSRPAPGA